MTTKTIASVGLALILTAIVSTGADARVRSDVNVTFDRHGGGYVTQVAGLKQIRRKHFKHKRRGTVAPATIARSRSPRSGTAQIVAHPAGCPSRAFCGCGASIEVFGRSIRELWLARNWFKFPPAAPAPGMVAVRRHHVFVIREVRGPGLVLAYDANSGGHQTRIHLRSLAGYSVRNPRGSRYASAL